MDYSKLRSLSEAVNGGGSVYVSGGYDSHKALTLDETISGFSRDLSECAREMVEDDMKMNDSLMEAAMVGDVSAVDALVEASAGNIGDKIKAFFQRVLNWVKSIIAKLRVHIDKIFMSGKKLYAKYHKSEAYERGDFDGLVVKGYKFAKVESVLNTPSGVDMLSALSGGVKSPAVSRLVGAALLDGNVEKLIGEIKTNANVEETDAETKKLKEAFADDSTKAERRLLFVSALVAGGVTTTEGDETKDIMEALYSGDSSQADIKYGNDNFTKEWIKDTLDNSKGLEDLLKQYTELEKTLGKTKGKYDKAASRVSGNVTKATKSATKTNKGSTDRLKAEIADDAEDRDDKMKELDTNHTTATENYGKSARSSGASQTQLLTMATTVLQEMIDAVSLVKQCRKTYEDAKIAQAKKFFGAMLTYKKPKTANEAYENYEMMATLAEI